MGLQVRWQPGCPSGQRNVRTQSGCCAGHRPWLTGKELGMPARRWLPPPREMMVAWTSGQLRRPSWEKLWIPGAFGDVGMEEEV